MSNSNEWETPADLFSKLDVEFHFTLDPCATPENTKCKKYYTRAEDGLSKDWGGEIVFMNPPYGREIGKWVKKAAESNATCVCLIPARTDTSYWHDYVMRGEIRFLRGRIQFCQNGKPVERLNKKGKLVHPKAPFPSAVVIFRNRTPELPR